MINQTIYPALITPYDEHGEVDAKTLEKLMSFHMEKGVKGFYIGGSSSECFLMNTRERKQVIDTAVRHAKGAATTICHVGSISTKEAVELAKFAQKSGADAVSAIAPFYYKFSKHEIFNYYNEILSVVDIPMILYNFPAFSGVDFTLDDFEKFYEDKRVVGVKYTSQNLFTLNLISQNCPEWEIMNGHDEVLLQSLASGAQSGIGSTYNFMPQRYLKIMDAYKKGDMETAQKEQNIANKIISILIETGVFQGIKYILSKQGVNCGVCRAPFAPLDEMKKKLLDGIMKFI